MRKFIVGLLLFSTIRLTAQLDTVQRVVEGRTNSPEQQSKPYVILISADGFRYDYAEKYQATKLLSLARHGVRAKSMIPSYPSLTFPNHYSIVTGLYPSHHGLASNYMYSPLRRQFYSMHSEATVTDSGWYGGTPLWVLAEQHHMIAASFFWVGSEAPIKGLRPTYYYKYKDSIPVDRRIQIVVNWLQLPPEKRPHLIAFYISRVDHEGHTYGPEAPETGIAVRGVDSLIGKLTDAVKKTGLPVNFIFLADHGMTPIDVDHPLRMPAAVDTSLFYIPRGSELVELYAKSEKDIMPTYEKLKQEEKNFKVYLKSNMPAHLHYGAEDDRTNRIGDILLVPNWPYVFNFSKNKSDAGAHGFDPSLVKDMHAVFYAWGPAFKQKIRVDSFPNVDVYPLVAKILGLSYDEKIDGTDKLAKHVLR